MKLLYRFGFKMETEAAARTALTRLGGFDPLNNFFRVLSH